MEGVVEFQTFFLCCSVKPENKLLLLIILMLIKMLTLWKSKNLLDYTWISGVGLLRIIE